MSAGGQPLDAVIEQRVTQSVLDALFGLGSLQALVDDERIENIDRERLRPSVGHLRGRIQDGLDPIAGTDEELIELLRTAAARFGLSERRFDLAHPELDLRLPDGSRLSALMAVVSSTGCIYSPAPIRGPDDRRSRRNRDPRPHDRIVSRRQQCAPGRTSSLPGQ